MITCGFCKMKDSEVLYSTYDIFGNTYDMNRCHNCKAVFLSPYPDASLLAQAYDESYYGVGDKKFNGGLIEKVLDLFRNRRANRIAKLMGRKGKILDIGCGNGRFLQMIECQGDIEGYGLEMASNSALRAKVIIGDRLQIGTLQADSYPEAYFDAITLFHVFEHLTDPKGYLENIQRILKPGGILYISFPNIDSLQSRIFKGDWLHLDPPRHLFFFGPNRFKEIMADYGFNTINEKHFNIEYNPFGFQQSLLNKITAKRELLYEALKSNKVYLKYTPSWKIQLHKLFAAVTAPIFIITDLFSSLIAQSGTVEFTLKYTAQKDQSLKNSTPKKVSELAD